MQQTILKLSLHHSAKKRIRTAKIKAEEHINYKEKFIEKRTIENNATSKHHSLGVFVSKNRPFKDI